MKCVVRGAVVLAWITLVVLMVGGGGTGRDGVFTMFCVAFVPKIARSVGWW